MREGRRVIAGNETVTAEAFVECFATVIAKTFAFSASKATVDAQCYRGFKNEQVRKNFEAKVANLELDCTFNSTMPSPKSPPKAPPSSSPKPPPKADTGVTVTV